MPEQKKKLRMDEIHVQSFITALSEDELLYNLRGGTDEIDDTGDSDSDGEGRRPRRTRGCSFAYCSPKC